uniref:Senescence regulator S40 n=1 Tax=Lotus japonicus TaxID=34305 RepID=I3T241_LOTJA|nr:unknown [Lotus japonicus]
MASRKSFLSRKNFIFPETQDLEIHSNPKSSEGEELELGEAEMWNLSLTAETAKKVVPAGSRSALKRGSRKVDSGGKSNPAVVSSSLPVNIPDWSKILKQGYKENRGIDEYAVGDDQDGGSQLPPHEYLARARGASFSVHEGKGRTLKGRDLRSVRNAIWKKVGFED